MFSSKLFLCLFLCSFEHKECDAFGEWVLDNLPQIAWSSSSNTSDVPAGYFPSVSFQRTAFMGWNDSYLLAAFINSSRNEGRFFDRLKKEFNAEWKAYQQYLIASERGSKSVLIKESNDTSAILGDVSLDKKITGRQWVKSKFTKQAKNTIISKINTMRKEVSPSSDEMYPVIWDPNLVPGATKIVDRCSYHNFQYLGYWNREDEAGGSVSTHVILNVKEETLATHMIGYVTQMVKAFDAEKRYWSMMYKRCIHGPCENYIRAIMKDNTRVGCDFKLCDEMTFYDRTTTYTSMFIACNFMEKVGAAPPYQPYFPGDRCSFCCIVLRRKPPFDVNCAGPFYNCIQGLCVLVTGEEQIELPPQLGVALTWYQVLLALTVIGVVMGTALLGAIIVVLAARWIRKKNEAEDTPFRRVVRRVTNALVGPG